MSPFNKNQKIGILCFAIVIAVTLHAGVLYFLQGMKIDFSSSYRALMENQTASYVEDSEKIPQEEIQRRNEVLAQVFDQMLRQTDEKQNSLLNAENLLTEGIAPDEAISSLLPEMLHQPLPMTSVSTDNIAEVAIVEELFDPGEKHPSLQYNAIPTIDVIVPDEKQTTETLSHATLTAYGKINAESDHPLVVADGITAGNLEDLMIAHYYLENKSGDFNSPETEESHADLNAPISSKSMDEQSIASPSIVARAQTMPQGPGILASSDGFTLQVAYTQKKNAPGYLFRVELMPKEGISFKRIAQNIFFLIDRSHSIRNERYHASKAAVLHALQLLKPGDTFNILIFDKRITRLSQENLPWNEESLAKAKQFLATQEHGGFFASTDLYSSLDLIIPEAVAANEVNIAILLSDGDTFLSRAKQRDTIGGWTHQNSGKIALYSVASGQGNNLGLLDVLSTLNKGRLSYAPTDATLGNAVMTLMHSIQNPIGKDIVVTSIVSNPAIAIKLYPSSSRLPILFENSPYVIYGSINELKDFTLFYQGKYYNKLLDIKQKVSFQNAKMVHDPLIEKRWAIQQAYECYEKYLSDGNMKHLTQASRLLAPYNIPVAFQ